MTIYLVRHAIALPRRSWDGDDLRRPLTARGTRQAAALAKVFEGRSVDRIYSSPALRCIDTMRPLARSRKLQVKPVKSLLEGRGTHGADLVHKAKHVVVCGHGDNLPAVLLALAGHLDAVSAEPPFAKGSMWVLRRRDGKVSEATYVKPPA